MRKKKKKERISVKNEIALTKLNHQLEDIKDVVKKKKLIKDNPDLRLLECENKLNKCDNCLIYSENLPECIWLRDTYSTKKCKSFQNSIYSLGAIDTNKINNPLTNNDLILRKKLRKYLPIAEKIDRNIEAEELAIFNDLKKKLQLQKIKEMKEYMESIEQESINGSNRKNLKSLL